MQLLYQFSITSRSEKQDAASPMNPFQWRELVGPIDVLKHMECTTVSGITV